MQAEDRIIHFSAELIHQPVQPRKDALQKLYFELSQTRNAGYDSTDFTNPLQPRFYSRRGPKTQSVALFLPDRALLLEEWTDIPLSDFIEKVRETGPRLLEARGLNQYMAHAVTIRSTFALSHHDDARTFIVDHVCAQTGKVTPHFHRPLAIGGLRFVLPETDEYPGALHVAIESFRHSRNEIFVEVKGVFSRRPVAADDIEIVLSNIRLVRNFISESVFPYLNQFDQPADSNGEGPGA